MSNERWGHEGMRIKRFSNETRRAKHREAIEDLMEHEFTYEQARTFVELTVNGTIRRLHFNY